MTSERLAVKPALGLVEFIALMALMTSLVALGIDAMLPALDEIGLALGAKDVHQTHLIVSLFIGGLAIGQLFFGPYSDARGRREAILLGLFIFVLGTIVCMLANDMTTLLVGRVIQAFGLAGPRTSATAVIRDQFAGETMAQVMSFIMMVFILVPMLAPMIGQVVLGFASWIHIFTLFLVVSLIVGSWYWIRQPETLPKENRVPFSWLQLIRSTKFIVTHPSVIGPAIARGAIFGAFLSYLSASQTIFQGFYNVGDWFAAIFATLAFAIGLASFLNGKIAVKVGMRKVVNVAMKCAVIIAVVFALVVHLFNGLPPLPLTLGILFFEFFFIGLLFGNLTAIAMQPLGDMAGLGAAIIGSLSSLLAVPVATSIDSFLTDNLYPIGFGFLVFISTAAAVYHISVRKG